MYQTDLSSLLSVLFLHPKQCLWIGTESNKNKRGRREKGNGISMMGPIRPFTSCPNSQPRHSSPRLQRAVGNPRTANISLFINGKNSTSSQIGCPAPILHTPTAAPSHLTSEIRHTFLILNLHCRVPLQFVRSSEQKLPWVLHLSILRLLWSKGEFLPLLGKKGDVIW